MILLRHHSVTLLEPAGTGFYNGRTMNFLAHLYLAGDQDAHRLGGLMGDFVKGPLPGSLPDDLAFGVFLHRRIDSFADAHEAFRRSRARVAPSRRRYAGVLVDMFYDHLLARHWDDFHPEPLADYAVRAYGLLRSREAELPAAMVPVARAMAQGDWLSGYADLSVMAFALHRMGERLLRIPNPLSGGEEEFLRDAAGFEADFREFVVAAKGMVAGEIRALGLAEGVRSP
jgi:acyl carrier protein phosphodiesterase